MRLHRSVAAALAGAGALLVGGGTALAQSDDGDRAARCQNRLERIAERQGISVAELEAKLKARALARIAAKKDAGRISAERAAALEAKVAAAKPCARAIAPRVKLAIGRGMLRAAAAYLELDRPQLRAALPGTSLAALAASRGKSVDGLLAAMVAPGKEKLERAVANGRLTRERADQALAKLEQRAERLAQKVFPAR